MKYKIKISITSPSGFATGTMLDVYHSQQQATDAVTFLLDCRSDIAYLQLWHNKAFISIPQAVLENAIMEIEIVEMADENT